MKQNKKLLGVGIAIVALSILTVFTYIEFFYISGQIKEEKSYHTYQYHYVMIIDNTDEKLWESVYESALTTAEKNDTYLELMGVNPSSKYSMLDYLEISEAEGVDGILISPDGTDEVSEKLKEITASGIPVVTLMQDDTDSGRISYVGINSLEMADLYVKILKKSVSDKELKVMILRDGQKENSIIKDQIKSALHTQLNEKLEIKVKTLEKNDTFEAEETVRDVFLNSSETPDVVICLNSVNSECASQAAVDYNKVGDVKIIGFFTSEKVLSSIQKGIIGSTVSIDTSQIGISGVEALIDYWETGFTSAYNTVDIGIVDIKNIGQYSGESADEK